MCAITTAMSVALMFFGGISYIFAYLVAVFAGVFMIMLKKTFGEKSAWITYTATSLLSFIVVADKDCMLMYVMFFGFYPIIHEKLDSIKPGVLRVLVKYLFFNAVMILQQLVLIYVFGIPLLKEYGGIYILILYAVLLNLLFSLYQIMIKKLEHLYKIKLEKRVKKYFK